MLFSRKLVHNWYMASEWIKEKYETRSDITSLGTQKYENGDFIGLDICCALDLANTINCLNPQNL